VDGSCEHGNEHSGSIKCWEVHEWLNNWRLFKNGSAPCASEFCFCVSDLAGGRLQFHNSESIDARLSTAVSLPFRF
jgi:hypothetical protein